MDNNTCATGIQISECVYCGKTTTASILDTAGIRLPLCKICKAADPTPPPHDPDLAPGWRPVAQGTRGPNPFRAIGVSVAVCATRWGVSRQAAHKRLAEALRGPGGAAACLALSQAESPPGLRNGRLSAKAEAVELAAAQLSLADLAVLTERLTKRVARLRRVGGDT